MKLTREVGFTLTELVIAMAVMAIGLALAVPSFQDMVAKKRLKLAAETVMADFNFFKQEGLKQRLSNFSFNVDDGASWCYGIELGSCTCSTANDCSVRQVIGSDFNGISSITSSASRFDYSWVRGQVTPGTITLNSPAGYDLQVDISSLGQVSMCTNSTGMFEYPSC